MHGRGDDDHLPPAQGDGPDARGHAAERAAEPEHPLPSLGETLARPFLGAPLRDSAALATIAGTSWLRSELQRASNVEWRPDAVLRPPSSSAELVGRDWQPLLNVSGDHLRHFVQARLGDLQSS